MPVHGDRYSLDTLNATIAFSTHALTSSMVLRREHMPLTNNMDELPNCSLEDSSVIIRLTPCGQRASTRWCGIRYGETILCGITRTRLPIPKQEQRTRISIIPLFHSLFQVMTTADSCRLLHRRPIRLFFWSTVAQYRSE